MRYSVPPFFRENNIEDTNSSQANIFSLLNMILEQRSTNIKNQKIPDQVMRCFPFLKDGNRDNFIINMIYNGVKIDLNVINAPNQGNQQTVNQQCPPTIIRHQFMDPFYYHPQFILSNHPSNATQQAPFKSPNLSTPFVHPKMATYEPNISIPNPKNPSFDFQHTFGHQQIHPPSKPIIKNDSLHREYMPPTKVSSDSFAYNSSALNNGDEDSDKEDNLEPSEDYDEKKNQNYSFEVDKQQKIKKLKNGTSLNVLIHQRKKSFLKDLHEDGIKANICKVLAEVNDVYQKKGLKAPSSFDWKPLSEQTNVHPLEFREETKNNSEKLVSNQIHLIREHWIKNPNCSIYVFKKRVYLKTSFNEVVNYDEIELSKRRLGKKLNKY